MELIKQIKDAEQQAKEIVEQARADGMRLAQEAAAKRDSELARAMDERRRTIDQAQAEAEQQGQQQAEELRTQAQQQIEALKQRVSGCKQQCVDRVVAELKQL